MQTKSDNMDSLAYAELYSTIAAMFRRFELRCNAKGPDDLKGEFPRIAGSVRGVWLITCSGGGLVHTKVQVGGERYESLCGMKGNSPVVWCSQKIPLTNCVRTRGLSPPKNAMTGESSGVLLMLLVGASRGILRFECSMNSMDGECIGLPLSADLGKRG